MTLARLRLQGYKARRLARAGRCREARAIFDGMRGRGRGAKFFDVLDATADVVRFSCPPRPALLEIIKRGSWKPLSGRRT